MHVLSYSEIHVLNRIVYSQFCESFFLVVIMTLIVFVCPILHSTHEYKNYGMIIDKQHFLLAYHNTHAQKARNAWEVMTT